MQLQQTCLELELNLLSSCLDKSLRPLIRKATTGIPHASDFNTVSGKPSYLEVITNVSNTEKYGSTLDDERRLKMKGLTKYLNDVQEELMDAVLYIKAARDELQDLSEEAMICRFEDEAYEERIQE